MIDPRTLLDAVDVVMWQADAATLDCDWVSRQLGVLLALDEPAWVGAGARWTAHLHPDDREPTLALCRRVIAERVDRQCVHRLVGADGRAVWFRTLFHVSRDQPTRLVGLMLDITEQMRVQDALGSTETRLKLILEQLPLVVWTTDRALRFTSGTGAALNRLGLEGMQLTNVKVAEYLQTADAEVLPIAAHRRALGGEAVTFDTDWGGRAFQAHLEPFRDAGGEIIGVIGVALDVTERRQAERERAAAAARWAFLANASELLSGSLDYETTLSSLAQLVVPQLADWCIVDVLEGERVRRVVVHAASGGELHDALRAHTPDLTAPHGIAEVLRSGRPLLVELDNEELRSDGVAWPAKVSTRNAEHLRLLRALAVRSVVIVPLLARGRTLGAITLCAGQPGRYGDADVELAADLGRRAGLFVDNARLYREAREAVRAREEFLSVASHELRTPVTSLLLALQSIEDEATVPRDHLQKVLESAGRQSRRLATLIDGLLDVSRIHAGRFQLTLLPLDLAQLAREVAARLEPDRARAGCTLTVLAEAPVVGRFDRSRLDQVLTNLLANAFKFGARQPIEVRVAADEATAIVEVRDAGIGVAPERQARIFEIFERAVSTQHYGGLGLGLYIVRRIVEAHHGTVTLTSEPQRGAVFTVRLPLAGPG